MVSEIKNITAPKFLEMGDFVGKGRNQRKAGFTEALEKAVKEVNDLQVSADRSIARLIRGDEQDLHTTMIEVKKAELSFQLMMQVRNKLIQAYNEVIKMPV